MLLIIPASWSSNFFYTYQFNNVNGELFNLRTRGLNNVFYWGAQMLGSVGIGYLLDVSLESRRSRGFLGIGVVAVFGTAIWGGGLANQLKYPAHDLPNPLLDFKASGGAYAGPFLLYFCYGLLLDAMFQSLVYWVIGALADDSEILSRYVGFYQGVQSAGGAVAWQIDTHHVSFLHQLITNWTLTTVSYPLLAILVMLAVNDNVKPEKEVVDVPALPTTEPIYNSVDPSATLYLIHKKLHDLRRLQQKLHLLQKKRTKMEEESLCNGRDRCEKGPNQPLIIYSFVVPNFNNLYGVSCFFGCWTLLLNGSPF